MGEVIADNWTGAKSQKWTTNRKHYGDTYGDQFANVAQLNSGDNSHLRSTKKLIPDRRMTGSEIIDKSCIKV